MKKKIITAVIIAMLCCLFSTAALAAPYQNYSFNRGWVNAEPQAYVFWKILDPGTMELKDAQGNVSAFKDPQDMDVSKVNADLAVADTGNSRIVILNRDYKVKQVIENLVTVLKTEQKKDEDGNLVFDIAKDEAGNPVLDEEGNEVKIPVYVDVTVTGFPLDGTETYYTLSNPQGVTFAGDGQLYVCDTNNARIMRFANKNGKYVLNSVFEKPEGLDALINSASDNVNPQTTAGTEGEETNTTDTSGTTKYAPSKVVVSTGGSMYVVSDGNYKGFIELSSDGSFTKFTGATKVKATLSAFLRRLLPEEIRGKMIQNFSTEYTNACLDADGMIFGTVGEIEGQQLFNHFMDNSEIGAALKRIAPTGADILKRNDVYPPSGDLSYYTDRSSFSYFVDVAVADDGIYSVLDRNRGGVFTYNDEGELLYIFGGKGNTNGAFTNPVAINIFSNAIDEENTDSMTEEEKEDYIARGQMILSVLDSSTGQITIFRPTEFGELVRKATMCQSKREYDQAIDLWSQVLGQASNSRLAYTSIGRIQYVRGQYQEACDNFKKALNRSEFSTAFAKYRNEVLEVVMPYMMTVIIIIILFFLGRAVFKKTRHFIKTGGRTND